MRKILNFQKFLKIRRNSRDQSVNKEFKSKENKNNKNFNKNKNMKESMKFMI